MVGFLGLRSLTLADLCNRSCLRDKFFWFYFLGSLADVVPYSLSMLEWDNIYNMDARRQMQSRVFSFAGTCALFLSVNGEW